MSLALEHISRLENESAFIKESGSLNKLCSSITTKLSLAFFFKRKHNNTRLLLFVCTVYQIRRKHHGNSMHPSFTTFSPAASPRSRLRMLHFISLITLHLFISSLHLFVSPFITSCHFFIANHSVHTNALFNGLVVFLATDHK